MIKKKLLFCIHNYFFLNHYFSDIEQLKKNFDITIIISNYLINNEVDKKLKNISHKLKVENFFIIPFYKKNLERNIGTILSSHIFMVQLKKKINFKEFDVCISDSKFFIWQKIILENYLNHKCIQIGVHSGSLPLELSIFKKLLAGEDILYLIKKVHKFREIHPTKRKNEKSIFKKIINVKNRFLDIYFDRVILSYIFYKKIFHYKQYDLNIYETDNFDYKIVFHHANYIFWNKWYDSNKKKVYLSKHVNHCNCADAKKNKIVFLSSILWENEINKISTQVESILDFVKKILVKNPNINQLHIKHHPMENDLKIEKINNTIKEKFKNIIDVSFLDKYESSENSACDYSLAFGMVSSILVDFANACINLKVYCLESLSKKEFDYNFYLKLLNERIIFLDDNNNINNNAAMYKQLTDKIDKKNFPDLIKDLSMQ